MSARSLANLFDGRLVARHQIAAAIGTGADFSTMVLLVELGIVSPPIAAVLSSLVGGIVNFGLSRVWAFRGRHGGSVGSQALRYATVSTGGAFLNGALLALVLRGIDIPYPLGRAFVSLAVGLLYTYPLHTRFVFRVEAAARVQANANAETDP
jgi:putative flippase GtrA